MTDAQMENEDPRELSRREFMDRSIKAIGAFIGLTMGIPAVGYLISPALQQQPGGRVRLGRTSEVEIGVPTLFTVTIDKTTGWVKSEIDLAYFVYTEDGINFTVMSNICTHLGCRTHWNEAGYIYCPCHDGRFDVQGNVIAGPPPRPLKRVEFQVDANNTILIREA
ncbi:MAG: ubiquinol-cytochrome c reductase iron-sulfur subunit [Chloroflexi bacterium]|nr:ubiquinol-cytochrome c reductase iron-sulfur subunit [Chloroflexota bacterium]